MPDIGYASMPVIPTFKGLQNDLERGTSKALEAAGVKGGDKFGTSAGRSAGKRFGSAFKSTAKVAALGATLAAAGAIAFARDSVAEAREAQKVGAITARVIKTTGKAAKVSAKQVGDLSTAISNKTGIDDEAIQSAANLLLTFTNVRNEVGKGNKVFDQATRLATDMGAALGGDPKSSAIQLGKALNDPVKGITALQRVGVSFTQQQKDQIGTLVKSGNTLKAQKIILGELNREFGGTAAASATTGEKVSVAFGNIKEKVGTALLPAIEDVEQAFLKKGVPALERFVDFMEKKGVPSLQRFGRKAAPIVRDVLGQARDILKDAQPYAEGFVAAFNKLPDGVKKGAGAAAVLGFGASKVPGGKAATGAGAAAVKGIFSLVSKTKPLPVFVVNNNGTGVPGGKGGTLGKVGKAAGVAGIGAGGLAIGTVAALTVGAIAAAKFGASVEKGHPGLPKFGSADNPMDPQALTPNFGKGDVDKKAESLKRAAFYAENVNRVVDKLPGKIERGFNPAENLKRGISRVKRESELATGQTKALGDMLFQVSRNWDKATAAKKRYNELQTLNAQGVTPARQSKVDRQLGGGGMYVANMNVHGTSLPEVRRDAQHQQRARAMGSESFR